MKKHTLKWLFIFAIAASSGCDDITPTPVALNTAVNADTNSGNTSASVTIGSGSSTATPTAQTSSPSQATNSTSTSSTGTAATTGVTPATTATQNQVSPTVAFIQQTEGQTAHNLDNALGTLKQYLAYVPTGYNQQPNFKWPIVVFLHGSSELGTDINNIFWTYFAWKTIDKKYPYILITPQLLSGSGEWSAADLDKMLDEVLPKYNVDVSRIIITGYSLGAHGVWSWAEHNPDRFAGVVPVAGWGDIGRAYTLKNIPIWAFHGDDDKSVNVSGSVNMINAIKNSGGIKANLTIYQGKGHDIHGLTYDNPDVINWMLHQKK